jgi:hypothetical protein
MATEPPKFIHDCDACIFLGRYISEIWKGEEVDLYVCPGGGISNRGTVISRFGDEGHEYESGLACCGYTDHGTEACRRAINGGHIDENTLSPVMPDYKYSSKEQAKMIEDGVPLDEVLRKDRKTLAQILDEYYGEGAWRKSA